MSVGNILRLVRCAVPVGLALTGLRAQTPDTAKTAAAPATKLQAFEERRAKGGGNYLTEEDLRKNDTRMLDNMLKRISGIRIVSSGMSEYAIASRTVGVGRMGAPGQAKNCYVSVYEDGVPLYTGTQQIPDFARMPVHDYAAVEFYRGSSNLPADLNYVRPSDCGVLLLWVKGK